MTASACFHWRRAPRCGASRRCAPRSTGRTPCSGTSGFPPAGSIQGRLDLDEAEAVCSAGRRARRRARLLARLVDKSLVAVETSTADAISAAGNVRQYALEKLGESREACDNVRTRHRDYYTSKAAELDAPSQIETTSSGSSGRNSSSPISARLSAGASRRAISSGRWN